MTMEESIKADDEKYLKLLGNHYKVEAFVHPKSGGDDYMMVYRMTQKPTPNEIADLLGQEGSAILDDYRIVEVSAKYTDKWKLFAKKEKDYKGYHHFMERWVEPVSKSGIEYFSNVDGNGKLIFVVRGFGIGTINPKSFTERKGLAPIQEYELGNEADGRRVLEMLMEFNYRLANGEKYDKLEKEIALDRLVDFREVQKAIDRIQEFKKAL
jgi:hypothetical protein